MDQKVFKTTRDVESLVTRGLKWWTWKRALVATLVILVVLEIGTYAFNWTWTGFKTNDTVWDWLKLLLIPIALAAVPIWFTAEEGQRRMWLAQLKWVLLATIVVLGVLCIGSYAFNWTWTGFKENGTLWDWLDLLLVPLIVAVLPIWYIIRQSRSNSESIQHEIG
jgi:hypothetical protein